MKKTSWILSAVALVAAVEGAAVAQDMKPAPAPAAVMSAPMVMGCDNGSCCDDGCRRGGLLGGIEFPVLWPHIKDATEFHSERGQIQMLPEHEGSFSFRFWGGAVGANGLGARVRGWFMDTDNVAVQFVDDDNNTINITNELEFDAVDVEGLKTVTICGLDLTISGGVRYGKVTSRTTQENVDEEESSDALSRFEGWGPTVAIEGVACVGDSGLGLFANTRASLLFGDNVIGLTIFEAGEDPSFRTARAQWDLVPVLEMQVGVEYAREARGYELFGRVALEGQVWLEATHNGSLIPRGQVNISEQEPNQIQFDDTIGLVGVTVGFGVRR